MKYLVLIYLTFTIIQSSAQEIPMPNDSLKKYSYFIYGIINKNSIVKGTFFLVKNNNKTYLLTASHVITGWNSIQNTQEKDYPDTMYLRLYLENGSKKIVKINTIAFKKQIQYLPYYEKADLFVTEIDLPIEIKINSIEEYMNVKYSDIQPETGFLYGYPVTKNNSFDSTINESSTKSIGKITNDIHKPIFYKDKNILDTINYYLDAPGIGGFSGSPVFLKDNNGEIYFGGMCFGGAVNQKWLYVVRPKIVIESIINSKNIITSEMIEIE